MYTSGRIKPEASGRVQSRERSSRLNMTSRLNQAMRGVEGGVRGKGEREGQERGQRLKSRRPREIVTKMGGFYRTEKRAPGLERQE